VTKLRIFLADDHAIVREGLKALIGAQPGMEVVGEAGDGATAVAAAAGLCPDVIILDVSMPGLSAATAVTQLKAACPRIRVLVLTVHEDNAYLRQFLEAGAAGYVLKRAAADDLVHALRTVAAGGVYLDPALAARVVGGLGRRPRAHDPFEAADLSEREEEVVRLIAQGHSNKKIAARLGLSVKTVETYKARALEKLGFSGRTELIRYALQRGWLQGL
jgi:DNA-binding NarL/FixJ family response regulator